MEARNLDKVPQDLYIFPVSDGFDVIDEVSLLTVTLVDQMREIHPFRIDEGLYAIRFPYPVDPLSLIEFEAMYVYSNTLHPSPKKIKMDERQTLLLKLNKFAYSPYPTRAYVLAFTGLTEGEPKDLYWPLATPDLPKLTSRVMKEPYALVYLTYYGEVPYFSVKPMRIMYDHNRPITRVITLDRSLWLSGWGIGVVKTEDNYELCNNGAELKSGFSHSEWMRGGYESDKEHFALSRLEFPVKPEAPYNDYYFTDKEGKMSTHQLMDGHIMFRPRYPIFGGSKYNFTMGWNNSMETSVRKVAGGEDIYIAQLPVLNTLRDIYYDNVSASFYLPENAELLDAVAPMLPDETVVSTELSHVKVTLRFRNLYDDMSKARVFVKYRYNYDVMNRASISAKFRYTELGFWAKVAKIAGYVFLALTSYYVLGLVISTWK